MKVLVIGGATIDVITSIDPENIECITMSNATNSYLMMEQGKKVEASRIDTQIGGGATNAAVAMSRMGAEVSCVLKLGDDIDGERILSRLHDEGVNTDFVTKHATEQTGKSVIVSSHSRNSGVFVNRGANTKLRKEDLDAKMFEDVDLVYISPLSSQSADIFPDIVKLAKDAGAFVACNLGIRQIRLRKERVQEALKSVDLLAINEAEAAALAEGYVSVIQSRKTEDSSLPELLRDGLGAVDARTSLSELAARVHKIGCQYLVVTNGAQGAYLCADNAIYFCPALPCEVKTTIGAGDAYNTTVSYSLAMGLPVDRSLQRAAVNASSVASCIDTQSGLLSQSELDARLSLAENFKVLSFPNTDEGIG
ncbi:MAG: carbohydrate kinase family protein [Sneathiella sp.]|nr:carbohydrate kinase family protein [Sneathiella sp.]